MPRLDRPRASLPRGPAGAPPRRACGGRRRPALTPRSSGPALAGLAALAALAARPAEAEPLRDNRYALDLFQGPVLAPIRVTGMAGAYAGYAEGIEGMVANAAAPAVREPFSVRDVEFDVAASLSIPLSIYENNDFDNSGAIDYDYSDFVYVTAGTRLQIGRAGAGLSAEVQRYAITDASGNDAVVTVGKYHVLAGVRTKRNELVLGAGARVLTFGLGAGEVALTVLGAAPEIGFLVRPDGRPFRIGATGRLPVEGSDLVAGDIAPDADGIARAGGLVLPGRAVLPWEIELGAALQLGPRPLNPPWPEPASEEARFEAEYAASHGAGPPDRVFDREKDRLKEARQARYWSLPRPYVLLMAELLVTGPVERGVSVGSFLGQNQPAQDGSIAEAEVVGSSGADVAFSPRLGIETEALVSRLHTRVGTYFEPGRLRGRPGRQHFTFGADLRAFRTTLWGLLPPTIYTLQASVDVAPRYESVSFGIGVWR